VVSEQADEAEESLPQVTGRPRASPGLQLQRSHNSSSSSWSSSQWRVLLVLWLHITTCHDSRHRHKPTSYSVH